ncbi:MULTISPECIES: ABC transporter ATP-binding protein [Corynebacterium]|uniref:Iron ABC transport system, ATP-binding protein n=3 Tax=Corynebacterium TaxID=1716 RepID=C3PER4_CORA7|nr:MULTISPECIES: ABC transporter ATP-binding protein [Corynebacterium]ACP32318.1 iron ABC transport system, ATP-binding protein [Corynebacterium aurimucosum ATCC 700975]MBE7340169.1 ABC transporter ATP-binding protein [Corynebacterium aurimucosum]MBE7365886.1 ABC transporter ATP-binding protein [Corynebacterium aurimucosum]MCQ9677287.1 ABC transporter ATP-binding protein [Corynebacterium sp. BF-R-2]MTD98453.1 ABC transporter ATP-binding protein [Corynebacterium guaraldiae]
MNARLSAHSVSVGYGDTVISRDVTLDIPDGQVTTLIGANGCGKSTLLRGLSHLLPLSAGSVTLDGKKLGDYSSRELATRLSMLPQSPITPAGVTVADLVARGRHPHQSWLQQWSASHSAAVDEAMALTNVFQLRDRPVDSLSGGQRQRVWIAMVLAQDTDIVFLDEPTTYLDLAHSIDVLELVSTLNKEQGKTIVMVLHDLNLAARYSDNLVLMKDGSVTALGSPESTITPQALRDVFGLDSRVIEDPVTGGPLIVPERP